MVARKSLRADFAAQSEWRRLHATGRFSQEYAVQRAYCWWGAFKSQRDAVTDYLEVGSWEGESTTFAAWLFPNARITAVDLFANRNAELRFDSNTADFSGRLEKLSGSSRDVLLELDSAGRQFDVILIDADHHFDSVMLDTLLAWPLLRVGGYMVWDDYAWTEPALGKLVPKPAIDTWLATRSSSTEVVFADYQVCVRKTSEVPAALAMDDPGAAADPPAITDTSQAEDRPEAEAAA